MKPEPSFQLRTLSWQASRDDLTAVLLFFFYRATSSRERQHSCGNSVPLMYSFRKLMCAVSLRMIHGHFLYVFIDYDLGLTILRYSNLCLYRRARQAVLVSRYSKVHMRIHFSR